MNGGFAVEFGGDRLLVEVFSLEDAAQDGLDHIVGAFVGRHVVQTKLVVQFLLRDVVRAYVGDDLSNDRRGLLFLPASGQRDRASQGQNRRGEAPPSVHKSCSMKQRCSPGLSLPLRVSQRSGANPNSLRASPSGVGVQRDVIPHRSHCGANAIRRIARVC